MKNKKEGGELKMKKTITVICCEPSASVYLNGINKNLTVDSSSKARSTLINQSKKANNLKIYDLKTKSQMKCLLAEVSKESKVNLGLQKIVKKGGNELASKNVVSGKYYLVVDGEGDANTYIKKPIKDWKKNNKENFERIKDNTYIVINNPCLEYYFLLHFADKHLSCGNADKMLTELKKHWEGYDKKKDTISKKIETLDKEYEVFKKNIKNHAIELYTSSIGDILNKDNSFWSDLLPSTSMGQLVCEYIKTKSKA